MGLQSECILKIYCWYSHRLKHFHSVKCCTQRIWLQSFQQLIEWRCKNPCVICVCCKPAMDWTSPFKFTVVSGWEHEEIRTAAAAVAGGSDKELVLTNTWVYTVTLCHSVSIFFSTVQIKGNVAHESLPGFMSKRLLTSHREPQDCRTWNSYWITF